MMYRFGPIVCSNLAASTEREWMISDGLGGYAMGTIGGLRTRRAHGLLAVAATPSAIRRLGLAAIDLTVVIGDVRYRLSTHETSTGVHPEGYRLLTRVDIADGLPRWYWAVAGVVVSLQLAMRHGQSAIGLQYRVEQAEAPVTLELEPLVTWRTIDGDRLHDRDMPRLAHSESGVVVDGRFRIRGEGWQPGGSWRHDLRYRREEPRSHTASEDLTSAGKFVVALAAGESTEIVAWSGDLMSAQSTASEIILDAQIRARRLASQAGCYDDIDRSLVLSADTFIGAEGGVVAGYPELGERTRDSLIAYRGLFLATARVEEGRALLLRYVAMVENGLLPDLQPDGAGHFASADASLWLFQAIYRHVEHTGDLDLASAVVPVLAGIINSLVSGSRHGIAVDRTDGLLAIEGSDLPRTWMDAIADGQPVTPRVGKPVELNALWLSGLGIIRHLAEQIGRTLPGSRLDTVARQAFARFGGIGGGLADVIDGPDGADISLRPNQLLAVTLPFPAWGNVNGVLQAVQPLIGPVGVRTLAPSSPNYRGTRAGTVDDHQGTAWPWLMGVYVDAVRLAAVAKPGILNGLEDHVPVLGVGSVSAMTDGDDPFRPAGSPFHAMATAEMLRIRRSLR